MLMAAKAIAAHMTFFIRLSLRDRGCGPGAGGGRGWSPRARAGRQGGEAPRRQDLAPDHGARVPRPGAGRKPSVAASVRFR